MRRGGSGGGAEGCDAGADADADADAALAAAAARRSDIVENALDRCLCSDAASGAPAMCASWSPKKLHGSLCQTCRRISVVDNGILLWF